MISDTGVGIAAEDLPLLFSEYRRIKGSSSTEGTGLGLYIVKNIVKSHGGTVNVESELGKGSTFVLRFPAQPNWRRHRSTNQTSILNLFRTGHSGYRDGPVGFKFRASAADWLLAREDLRAAKLRSAKAANSVGLFMSPRALRRLAPACPLSRSDRATRGGCRWVEEVELAAGKKALGPVIEPVDRNFFLREDFASLHQSFRCRQ